MLQSHRYRCQYIATCYLPAAATVADVSVPTHFHSSHSPTIPQSPANTIIRKTLTQNVNKSCKYYFFIFIVINDFHGSVNFTENKLLIAYMADLLDNLFVLSEIPEKLDNKLLTFMYKVNTHISYANNYVALFASCILLFTVYIF